MIPQPNLSYRPQGSPSLQASKWLSYPLLIDAEEMRNLFTVLQPFWIFLTGRVVPQQQAHLTQEEFLDCYHHYIDQLRQGHLPQDDRLRSYFFSVFTRSIDALYAVRINETQCLVKVAEPILQMQAHQLTYSTADESFRSAVFGPGGMEWGVQFSYPQLYQDAQFNVKLVRQEAELPNTVLFKILQKWLRDNTRPTPFQVGSKRVNVPVRLGKQCFNWINHHPQLAEKGIKVINPSHHCQ